MTKFLMILSVLFATSSNAAELTLLAQGKDLQGKEVRLALHSSAQSFPAIKLPPAKPGVYLY